MFKEGIYEEIINKQLNGELQKLDTDQFEVNTEELDTEEARKLLSSYISEVARMAMKFVRDSESNNKEALIKQIQASNEMITTISNILGDEELKALHIEEEGQVLSSVYSKINKLDKMKKEKIVRPVTPISQSSLFTGSHSEPNMMSELQKEILSSDHIDMLVSFIKWSGLRCIIEELKTFTERGGQLRVITTSYMEATDYKAIMELSGLQNTEIKISYDVERTRLHAKAYMFKRDTGFSTAYIGSSNLSNPALTSGLEWNIKVTAKDSFDIVKKFEATFESYWNNEEFMAFDAVKEKDREVLKRALKKKEQVASNDFTYPFDIQPYYYQKEMLDQLQVERDVFKRFKNLLVAATGVGKTVISAFDYKRFQKYHGRNARLLFVAHREEILRQSRDTFRAILKDANFGDLLVGGFTPSSLDHLFVSIQSLNSIYLTSKTTSDFYDFIIVDEFHHAAAPSYQKLLRYYQPKILLGLTATPERMDGESVLKYFDHQIASEMRLTEAIDRKLLSPFQYFCVSDNVDLSKLKWTRRGYDIKELENVYTSNKIRTNQIIRSLHRYVTDINDVKGLGFCVSVEHAKYMSSQFNLAGIPSMALHGESKPDERRSVQDKLVRGNIKFIFVVDLYNEGIDIPEINTILFLRPTESNTVFLQQFGRGLRLAEDKECLTVLDFIGQAHKNYNFEEKFRFLVGKTKHSIQRYVEEGFFNLPKGCFIQLEKQAKEYILRNIKQSSNTRANLISKLKYFKDNTGLELTLENFLEYYHITLYDFYGKNGDRSFKRLLVEADLLEDFYEADLLEDFYCEDEKMIIKRIPNLFHLNSKKFLEFLLDYINARKVTSQEEKLMVNMFYYSFYNDKPAKEGFETVEEGIDMILKNDHFRDEIIQILHFNYHQMTSLEKENHLNFESPLGVHSSYTRSQALAALDYFNEQQKPAFREGVKYFEDKKLDVFFITLNKSEKDFSPSTLYEDYAINETLFHWQSQSTLSVGTPTAKRYINHKKTGNQIALFVREYNKENGYTSPFVFLGTADYVKHTGNKPISFVWRLREEMPPAFVVKANKNIM